MTSLSRRADSRRRVEELSETVMDICAAYNLSPKTQQILRDEIAEALLREREWAIDAFLLKVSELCRARRKAGK